MMMERELRPEQRFVLAWFPWFLAAAAFLVYLGTLNHWVSLKSLPLVASVSGWTFSPELKTPLFWLITYPLRWLPVSWIPITLNLFAALCASLTIYLLARSAALLPHDRTEDERARERGAFGILTIPQAWLPPLLAVALCGFQLTFWESATAASNDMLDLLLLAWCMRCLLEFRLDERDSWLTRASFVYGAAMTNNWAMIALFPFFLAALVRLKGIGFFNIDFLARMVLLGLAGLSFYLVLPLAAAFAHPVDVTFWAALKANLVDQKYFILLSYNRNLLFREPGFWVLALPTLLPLLAMSIRWPSYFGDPSKLGVGLASLMFHCLNLVLFLFCGWVCLDPEKFSIRNYGLQGLPFYYFAALSAGYYAGYFLLVFGAKPSGRLRPATAYSPLIQKAVVCVIWLVAAVFGATIVCRNLPEIRLTNGPLLQKYAQGISAALPPKAILLADNGHEFDFFLTQSALANAGKARDYAMVHTGWLRSPDYHRYLARRYPDLWKAIPSKDRKESFQDVELMQVVFGLSESNAVYYLHPSFGYYFELFYPVPHGLVYELKRFPDRLLFPPGLAEQTVSENEAAWSKQDFASVIVKAMRAAGTGPRARDVWDKFVARLHLARRANLQALQLAFSCSRSADLWGVLLQRSGRLQPAKASFERALELNPNNSTAQVNLESNGFLQQRKPVPLRDEKSIEEQFARYRGWNDVLNANGPFDDPSFSYSQGLVFAQALYYHQAAQEFARSCELAPSFLPPRFWKARLCALAQMPAEALKEVAELRQRMAALGMGATNQADLLSVEMSAHLVNQDPTAAEAAAKRCLQAYPRDEQILAAARRTYMSLGYYTNALELIERQLKFQPDDPGALVDQGFALLHIKAFDQAIRPLSRVISLETTNFSDLHYTALLNRAVCYLLTGKLDESKHDYEALQKVSPTEYKVAYGLADIAYRRRDTNAAVRNYRIYLAHAPTNTTEAKEVFGRLREMNQGQL